MSFYKEPLILLSFSIIIFNFIYTLLCQQNLKLIIFSTFLVLISFILINYIKPEYYLILLAGYLIGIFLHIKNFKELKFLFNSISDNSFIFFAPKNYSIFFYEFQNNLNSNYFKIKINDVINF